MTMDQLVNHAARVTLILLLTGMFLAGIRLVNGPDHGPRSDLYFDCRFSGGPVGIYPAIGGAGWGMIIRADLTPL